MTGPEIPKGYDAVKIGKEVVGCVSRKPRGMFGHYEGKNISADGKWEMTCGTSTKGRAIEFIKDSWERANLTQKPWHVRLTNGSRCIVMAANEAQALEKAQYRLKRFVEKELMPVSAYMDEDMPENAPNLQIDFGLLHPPASSQNG